MAKTRTLGVTPIEPSHETPNNQQPTSDRRIDEAPGSPTSPDEN
jgi:hypothetical protein